MTNISISTSDNGFARLWAMRIGVITLIFTGILVLMGVSKYGALDFARIGTRFSLGDPTGSGGYDGQFAYYIARYGANAVPFIDGATLRYQRILYPVVARVLAFGNVDLVPYTLIVVNVIAHTLTAALTAYLIARLAPRNKLAPRNSLAPLAALVITGWLGAIFAVRLDLNEPLCFALALGAVAAYLDDRPRLTTMLLILSVLAKETGLVFALGIGLHAVMNAKGNVFQKADAQDETSFVRVPTQATFFHSNIRIAKIIFAINRLVYFIGMPMLAFLVWWGVLYITFGTLPTRYPAARNIQPIPFNGLFAEESAAEFVFLALWLAIPTLLIFIAAARTVIRTRTISLGAGLALAGAGFVMLMPDVSWVDPVAAYRVGMPIVVCGLIYLAEHHPRWLRWASALWLPSLALALITPGMW